MRAFAVILLIASVVPAAAGAFESLPEFHSLTEGEQRSFEAPILLGSEYASHHVNYDKPWSWERDWLARDIAIDGASGSLTAAHFRLQNRVKARKKLSERLEFRFLYFDESDRELQQEHALIELDFKILPFLALALYGEPSFRKSEDDTGIALLFTPSERHEIRLFNTFVDVTRLRRNDGPDSFVEPDLPYSRGLVGRAWDEEEFFEYAFRQDTPTAWRFPTESYVYGYRKLFASIWARRRLGEANAGAPWIGARAQWDRKTESRSRLDPSVPMQSGYEDGNWTTSRFLARAELAIPALGPSGLWEITPGIDYQARAWKTQSGDAAYRDWIAFTRWSLPAWGDGATRDSWHLGYDVTWHRRVGSDAFFAKEDLDGALEHRLATTYAFVFPEGSEIRLMATFDLDQFGTKRSWEGGNAQFKIAF